MTALLFLVLIGGLLLFAAFNFPKRANWARVVCWVFCGLAALGLVLQFVQPAPIWYRLPGIVSGLVAIAIIVLLARPDANAWFSQRPAAAR